VVAAAGGTAGAAAAAGEAALAAASGARTPEVVAGSRDCEWYEVSRPVSVMSSTLLAGTGSAAGRNTENVEP